MKKFIAVIFLFGSTQFGWSQFTIKQWQEALDYFKKQELHLVIQEAEKEFETLYNDYRISKKRTKQTLRNEAYLMAFNHSMWMAEHKKMTHFQKKRSDLFSGVSPKERLEFLASDQGFTGIAENVAFFEPTQKQFDDKENLGKLLAQEFFDLWVISKDHRANLIAKENKFFGFAIQYNGKKFYATHVFLN